MSGWAEIDNWKRQRLQEHSDLRKGAELVRQNAREAAAMAKAHQRRFNNLLRRFHELPADLAHACVVDARYTRGADGNAELRFSATSAAAQAASDWLEEHRLGPSDPLTYRPACAADVAMIKALAGSRFPPASFAKRFVRQLAGELAAREAAGNQLKLTHHQALNLRHMVHTFRRQIRREQLPPYAWWLLDNRGSVDEQQARLNAMAEATLREIEERGDLS